MSAAPKGRRIAYRPIAELVPNPRNPKAHDLSLIDSSVGRFGFVEPIVVDGRTGQIISGHGRAETLRVMEKRGETPPEGIQLREGAWLVPTVTGWSSRTDTEANAALIALNRSTEVGGWVDDSLLELLDELSAVEGGTAGVGFDDVDLSLLRDRLADEAEDLEEEQAQSEGRGRLLSIADLSLGDPKHTVHHGDHWVLDDRHHLFVVNPHREWRSYVPILEHLTDAILAPYPDVWLPITDVADAHPLVLVQPLPYLAGHLLDKYASVRRQCQIVCLAGPSSEAA